MQPSYLPWVGYFNLIMNSDVFIFLDDVQYSKNSFFSRNRYPSNSPDGFNWLTVPVRRLKSAQTFRETLLVEDGWRRKHLETLKQVYGKNKYFGFVYPLLEKHISNLNYDNLASLNIGLIMEISEYLEIRKEFYLSSELKIQGQRSERLLSFCDHFKCDTYISPLGAKDYIVEDNVLPSSRVNVVYQDYKCIPYEQIKNKSFIPYMSIIDILFRLDKSDVKKNIYQ